jgi:1,4-dihydroxy-2-naphthoyl-CoA synthase
MPGQVRGHRPPETWRQRARKPVRADRAAARSVRPVAIYGHAAVNGKALGGGCKIVLACDLVVAAGDTYMTVAGQVQATVARMTYPESRRSAMRMRARERMHRHG